MQIINLKDKIDEEKLKEVANIIKNGGVVVFPTETVYGIGVNAYSESAVKKLYEIKKRNYNKPISLLISNFNMINDVAKDITKLEYALINEFFPGPLTVILKKKDIVPDIVTSNGDTVGVRMSTNEIALRLIEYAGVPIATTSCNISGEESKVELADIIEVFDNKVDCYIDGGKSKIGIGSTVVNLVDNKPEILREGVISKEQIIEVCNKYITNK